MRPPRQRENKKTGLDTSDMTAYKREWMRQRRLDPVYATNELRVQRYRIHHGLRMSRAEYDALRRDRSMRHKRIRGPRKTGWARCFACHQEAVTRIERIVFEGCTRKPVLKQVPYCGYC